MVVDDPCPVCLGSGRGKSTKTMQVRIPAGVTDGQRIRLKGRGGAGENGGAPGDLYVIVHVRPHPIFGRKGDNLTLPRQSPSKRPRSGRRSRCRRWWPAGQAAVVTWDAQWTHPAGTRQGCPQARRHKGRPAGHCRGVGAPGAQRSGPRGPELLCRGGWLGESAGEALRRWMRCDVSALRAAAANRS